MARNPKQDANLTHKLTASELRKGGKNSGKKRRQIKSFKDALKSSLTPEKQDAMIAALERNAQRGSLPHLEFLLEVLGQHPDQGTSEDRNLSIAIEGSDEYAD